MSILPSRRRAAGARGGFAVARLVAALAVLSAALPAAAAEVAPTPRGIEPVPFFEGRAVESLAAAGEPHRTAPCRTSPTA